MSTNINANVLKNFITNQFRADHITQKQAQKYGIDKDTFTEANVDENLYLDIDEILDNADLYEQFATMYVEEKEEKQATKDKEKEKEEQIAVKNKNGTGV